MPEWERRMEALEFNQQELHKEVQTALYGSDPNGEKLGLMPRVAALEKRWALMALLAGNMLAIAANILIEIFKR